MLAFKNHGTTDRDCGEKAILAQVEAFKNAHIDVGIFEGEEHPESELPLAGIAAVQEFGSKDKRVPERSHLRRTFREQTAKWGRLADEAITRIIDSKGSVKAMSVLAALGELMASDVRRTINSVTSPPKAESTIRREGGPLGRTKSGKVKKGAREHQRRFDHPLIWLGYLRAAYRARVQVQGAPVKMTRKGAR